MSQPFTIKAVKLDGSDVNNKGLISQMRPYRLSMKMKTKEMVMYCKEFFGSSSNLSGIEHNRQSETTAQLIAYAKRLGVKELTIKIS